MSIFYIRYNDRACIWYFCLYRVHRKPLLTVSDLIQIAYMNSSKIRVLLGKNGGENELQLSILEQHMTNFPGLCGELQTFIAFVQSSILRRIIARCTKVKPQYIRDPRIHVWLCSKWGPCCDICVKSQPLSHAGHFKLTKPSWRLTLDLPRLQQN